MHRRRPAFAIVARLSLLLAIASYIAVATMGPWAHLAVVEVEAAQMAQSSGEPENPGRKAPVPPHDESHCLLCHSFESLAVPAAGAVLPLATLHPAPPPPEPTLPSAAPTRPLPQARAPPRSA